ncbi:hypothetical protein ACG04R_01955 [Roseateles sp. BYS78W]|uniref:Major facilitator superfamily (MFS) profile domain-containing protein n=1 Tax=Pelomonas candidula TaxID=3299025 RepID=A0ABW7H688_9BURK
MSEGAGSVLARFVLLCLLAVATLGFGAAGLCGAVFTFMGTIGLFQGGPENFSAAILVISVPSLLIGGALAWWLGRKFFRASTADP